jgi:hypothetical protein
VWKEIAQFGEWHAVARDFFTDVNFTRAEHVGDDQVTGFTQNQAL